ncbi:fimbria/pilus outer membrane usher protein [Escherichia coli]|uniref:fimbria/pilus outer membrane usher protein n=1 Tax=Escherichia coli TaxID=562 RepID=UPI002157C656|nr:fimbria/pilus outer membrane usher protein [Escherichia coli]
MLSAPLWAAEDAEFDPSFLSRTPGSSVIDVRRFTHGNPVPSGNYYSDIYLNGEWKGNAELSFRDMSSSQEESVLCVTPELLSILDVSPEAVAREPDTGNGRCMPFSAVVPDAKIRFDLSLLRLNVEIPQAMLVSRPRGYISPSQWQTGVPAAFVSYDVNHWRYRTPDMENNQSYLGLRAGFNAGGWAFRHRGTESWSDSHAEGYRSIETNLQHDIAMLRAQLTLGDFTTTGELMDSNSLRGIRLASDDRMLPGSLRGYAPVVRGVAGSNARVTVRQNGNIIYETTVPAGPFSISDLYPSGYGGDLTVTVTESDGQTRSFIVPFASVAQLVRPGFSRWQVAAGRYRYGNRTFSDTVFQGTLQYGLTNDITLNTGMSTAPHYLSGLGGVAFNTPLGAVATDITLARTTFPGSDTTHRGYSLHAGYSARIPETSTNVTLAAYRYSSRDFWSLRDAILTRNRDVINDSSVRSATGYRPRNQLQLTVNQSLGEGWGNLYLTGATYHYWGHTGTFNEYQAGYNNVWKKMSYQIGFSQTRRSGDYHHDNRFFFSFSLPLSDTGRTLLSTTVNVSDKNSNSIQSSISGVSGDDNQLSYGVSLNTQENGPTGYAVNGSYRSPVATLQATAGNDSRHNRQISAGISGAIVAHPFGVTASNDLGDTFTVIHADGAGGAVINNAPGNRLDPWGNGIVPYVTPYEKNYISIDPTALAADVELSATEREIIPRANSTTMVTFTTKTGKAMLFDVKMPDGTPPPMAAEALTADGKSAGYIAQGGRLFVRDLDAEKGMLRIVWGSGQNDSCVIHYNASGENARGNAVPENHHVVCMRQ